MQAQQPAQASGSLTVSSQALEAAMLKKLQPNDKSILLRVFTAGMKILFSPQTHQQMLQEFEQQMQKGVDVGQLIGTDITHIMVLLFNESKGSMPKGVLVPVGTLLIAKACEFLNEEHIAPVTDQNFSDAVHVMTSAVMAKFDAGFAAKVGAQQTPVQNSQPASPSPAPQQAPSALQQGGM